MKANVCRVIGQIEVGVIIFGKILKRPVNDMSRHLDTKH